MKEEIRGQEPINHILFTCPPTLQTWALSEIPSAPGLFPSNSLYENFDYLLWPTSLPKGLVLRTKTFPI
ncbi:BnaC08g09290D [Brassica napus]|uniref:BnaC08g09290D protein n=1 Tax=Brassica napus TaxID=3708 RepID=A0A078FDH8_BRANA|nr:BnaC08g09290D [Brassica napus]